MVYPKTQSQSTVTRVRSQTVAERVTCSALAQCLVVSPVERRGLWFARAATDGGWRISVCRDVAAAVAAAARIRFHLAFLDLHRANGGALPGLRGFAESLAVDGTPLLIICGNDGDTLEEIWAHQLGTWLYLPGVDEASDLVMVCTEARRVVEKLHPQLAAKAPVGAMDEPRRLFMDG